MAGFFLNTLANARITLCAKEVELKLKIATEEQSCRVALLAALLKTQMINVRVPGGITTVRDIAEHPQMATREQCYAAYCLLEDVRDSTRREDARELSRQGSIAKSANNYEAISEIAEFMEISDLALNLLMATIGVGCTTSGLSHVTFCWNHMASLPVARCDILRIMHALAHGNNPIEQPIESDEWIALARKVPEFLSEP